MGMLSEPGPRLRLAATLRRRKLLRLKFLVPVVLLGCLFSLTWCSPDGAPLLPTDAFLLSLHSLATDHARKVRILHFGDSHIASDSETAAARADLQARFGDGGAGLWLPWGGPRLSSLNVTYGSTSGWQRSHPSYNSPLEDTGLALSYIEAESPGQRAWLETPATEFRVDYLAQPWGGDVQFLLDGLPLGQRRMSASFPQVESASFQAPGADVPHRFEIRTLDSGRVRILGVSAEKSAPGVVYSALGLVGARAEYLLKCREQTFEAQIAAEQPDMVILGYGTNETSGSYLDRNAYEATLTTIIARVRRAAPSALVVLLTPPDRGDRYPGRERLIQGILQQVMAAEREVAGQEGAILMDLHTAMGGAGSAERWAAMQPPLARPDMIHFTTEGYNLLGSYIAGGITKLFDSGIDTAAYSPAGAAEQRLPAGEILPSLYSAVSAGAVLPASSTRGYSSDPAPSPAKIFYFLRSDGQVIVTNDLSSVDFSRGKAISADQARCLLRGKTLPCDNADRW